MTEDRAIKNRRSEARFRWRAALGTVIALALAVLVDTRAMAAKPPPGGGDGGGTGGGTIYYRVPAQNEPQSWSMNSDGSGKTPLPVNLGCSSPALGCSVPSRLPHGGFRWFLQKRAVGGTYPNGEGRTEIFAVRGDGDEAFTKQLTDSPVVQTYFHGTWRPGDDGISEVGREFDPVSGTVVDGGIYGVDVLFDTDGNVANVPADPFRIVGIELYDVGNTVWPNAEKHDWSPNEAEIVLDTYQDELKIVEVATNASRLLTVDGGSPRWSPNGAKILFDRFSGIWTIGPDGNGEQQILQRTSQHTVITAFWSPTGSHVTYYRYTKCGFGCILGDVYRATATGTARTNLTGDVSANAFPLDWR